MANYNIIGSDGKEYGPISVDDLRKWVTEGRADSHTKVRAEGTTEWVSLSQLPEFGSTPRAASPPPLPTVAPASGKLSTMAVLSLVLGILGLFSCGGTALFGLILGIIAMVKVSNSQGVLRGKGLALAGIIVSGVFLLLLPFFAAAMLLPALAAAKQKAQTINCVNNEKQLALAVRIYAGDNTNHLPSAATWCDAIKATAGSEKIFKCPAKEDSSQCDYAYNAKLDGIDADSVNPQTVMIFESDTGWNAHGGPELLATGRHGKKVVVAFADGSAQTYTESQLGSLRWDP